MAGTTKLFVGNIMRGSDPADLRMEFENFGRVAECDIVSDYGFVHYTDPAEANAALALHGKMFNGQKLKVEISTSYVRQKAGAANLDVNTCYVCGDSGHWAKNCPQVPEDERDRQMRRAERSKRGGPDGRDGGRDSRDDGRGDPREHRNDYGYDDEFDYPPRRRRPPPPDYYDDYDDIYYRRRPPPPRYYDPYDYDSPPRRRQPPPGYYRDELDDYPPPRRPPRLYRDSMDPYGRDPPYGPPGPRDPYLLPRDPLYLSDRELAGREAGYPPRDFIGRDPGPASRDPALDGRDPALDGRDPAVDGRDPALASRDPALDGRDPALAGRDPALAGRDPALAGREPALAGRDPALAGRDPALGGRDPAFAGRDPAFAGRDPAFAGRDPGFPGRDPAFAGRDPALAGRYPALAGRNPYAARDREVAYAREYPYNGSGRPLPQSSEFGRYSFSAPRPVPPVQYLDFTEDSFDKKPNPTTELPRNDMDPLAGRGDGASMDYHRRYAAAAAAAEERSHRPY